ncbi:superoxide dismutase [Aureimonas flava]|uniref:Superoxide dismutase n=1 Tax=Aureimonas flava TaxID=2320271 RepID=A0A3A1WQW7_9HYPH|nr:superoxide dismutase [Aureimonas flava]RIY03453.1 superoxide dismutase [Aureimonas flava]
MRHLPLAGTLAALTLTAGALALPQVAAAQQTSPASGQQATQSQPFSLPELPYAYDALAPIIDAQTMELHHSKHHQAFVTALNNAAEADPQLAGLSLEEIVASAGERPAGVRNSAGGHWNHTFFWQIMAPEGERGEPSAELTAAIDEAFGSMDEFKQAFQTAGTGRFGSGWAWLIVGDDDKLAITSTPNQDNPLMDVAETKGTPVLGNDVWEHAYYLTYNNRRADYLSAWWDAVNWTKVSENYAEAAAR